MSESSYIPANPEVDQYGQGDDLPTYDDLAAQNGPNSRFGRWKEWIEKRAAERYADLTPEVLEQRRQRGWGDSNVVGATSAGEASESSNVAAPLKLRVQTDVSTKPLPATPPDLYKPLLPSSSIGEALSPTHLEIHHFGSRFLPHSTAPIRCVLPLVNDRLILIGHDDGLSVLDMYPKEWDERGLVTEKGPAEATAKPIWTGEGVYQMDVLESGNYGEGSGSQGVLLALVGPDAESPKDLESVRSLRMYNLSNLVSLAKWAASQRTPKPLDLRHYSSNRTLNASPKRHRKGPSITKGLRNLVVDSPVTITPMILPPSKSYTNNSFPSAIDPPIIAPFKAPVMRTDSNDSTSSVDSSWDVVEDFPLRWATDFVPLANNGSRLLNTSVLFYSLWRDEHQRHGGAYLAVVTKSNIFLYQTPRGERAFHFVKEFYTPITARNVSFVQQAVQESMSRSSSDAAPRSQHGHGHSNNHRHSKPLYGSIGHAPNVHVSPSNYSHQLSLFVVFEKKAGLIRIADSAVGEVDLFDEAGAISHPLLSPLSTSSMGRRSRSSWDGKAFQRESRAAWISPVKLDLPMGSSSRPTFAQSMYILTRGKQSHFVAYPLPASITFTPPYRVVRWSSPPTSIATRICHPSDGTPSFLQILGFGDDGVEVQEVLLSSLSERKFKGKGRPDEILEAQGDVGGSCGYLCVGGHWNKHSTAVPRFSSSDSIDSEETLISRMAAEQGMYAWVRKGLEDWRIFWVGGSANAVSKSSTENLLTNGT